MFKSKGRASILFLTSGRSVPSSRFRVLQFLPRFREEGFRVRVAPCVPTKYASHLEYRFGGRPWGVVLSASKRLSRLVSVLRSPFHDLVFLERELLPRSTIFFEKLAARVAPALHFDFDDAIHLKYDESARNPVRKIIRLCHGVTAGNEWLATFARKHNSRVHVVPTAIDTNRFRPRGEGDVPFVWTGSRTTIRYLEFVAPALRRVPGARLLVICDQKPPDLGFPVEFVPWNEVSEVEALCRGRVGIMPLPMDEWSKGKCGFKLLEYMACGIPCVATDIGVNPEILQGGECGLLVRTEDEWVEALTKLSQDAQYAKTLGELGRRRVEEAYSVNAVYPVLRSALVESICAGRSKT